MPFKKDKNGNWVSDPDGDARILSNPNTFTRPRPPVRDGSNRPLKPGGGGEIDWDKWAEEIEEAKKNED